MSIEPPSALPPPPREGPPETGAAIEVRVNGRPQQLPMGTTVRGLLSLLRLEPAQVAVERNGEVLPRREHDQVTIAAGDQLEVVTFVGGG